MDSQIPKKIVVVGGGFGGIRTALDLSKKNLPNTKIILISDKPHFEYHAGLYRIVVGRSPLEVCIPLRDIFQGKHVEVVEDTINEVDLKEKRLGGTSGSRYNFDFLVLALGSETSYFDLPGLKELSFGFKSISDALKLKRHIHEMFSSCVVATDKERECALRFVIVGGGATGVELACELALYTKKLAAKHALDNRLITIDLIDANDRLLRFLPPHISKCVVTQVEKLGVRILLNKRVVKKDIETVYLKDMQMRTKTVIWTAGVKPHYLYEQIKGLTFDEHGKVVVDESLQGSDNVFVIGDAAATAFSGMAQTAADQGSYVASVIAKKLRGETISPYPPKKPFYAIPIGSSRAVFVNNYVTLFGRVGWFLRRFADLQFFLSILPWNKALIAFQSDRVLWEQCPICSREN